MCSGCVAVFGGSLGARSRSTSVHLMYSRSSSFHKDLNDLGWEEDHNWLFGVTGEQEWTPEVQTGTYDNTNTHVSPYIARMNICSTFDIDVIFDRHHNY